MSPRLGAWLKRIDALAAPPACAVGALVGKLRRAEEARAEPLIVRPGGMGDLICAHLALEQLGVPLDSVRWLIEPRAQPWAEHARLRFDLIAPPRLPPMHRHVIDTEQRFGLSIAYSLLARGGTLHAFDTNRARHWADAASEYDPLDAHELDSFTRLFADALGLAIPPRRPFERRLPASGGIVVGIAGRQEPTRALSLGQWSEFIAQFTRGAAFTLVAAPVDAAFAEALAGRFPGRAALHRGSFSSVCDLIARCESFLTIDGGLVHVASYYGVPTTAIFTGGREKKWAPLAAGSVLVRRSDLSCQPCTLFGQTPRCPHALACQQLDFTRDQQRLNPRS